MKFLVVVSLLLSGCAPTSEFTASDEGRLTFVHLNDTYRVGAVEDGTRGGFGRVVTLVRQLQREGRDIRVTHAGDFLYPSLESQLWHGQQMVEALNFIDRLAPMYLVAGNHEFDDRSPDYLADAIGASEFDWLGDNYRLVTGNRAADEALHSTFVYEHAGKRVGLFALTLEARDGGNDRDYIEVGRNYKAVAERQIEQLEERGVDLIIGLTHLHMATDVDIATLKKDHPKFAFILGGHDHEPQYSAATAGSAAVMKGASNARTVWQVDVLFDTAGDPVVDGRRIELDDSVAEDDEYATIERKWRQQLLQLYPSIAAKLGEAALPLDATEESIRGGESSWGNFIADQMRGAFGEPGADFAFVNSGSLRIDDYILGDILIEDVARTFGFSSFLRRLEISGREFRNLMETGYRGAGSAQGYFPQVSGFRVCVDRSRAEFDRIVSLQVAADGDWTDIDADSEYTLVMPDFLFNGGDNYLVPERRKAVATPPGSELKYLVIDAIIRAQAAGRKVGQPVDPARPRYVQIRAAHPECWPE